MIELDMVYVSYFGDFLSKGSRESFEQNILFRLSPPRKAARAAGKAARPGLCKAGPAWPLRNTECDDQDDTRLILRLLAEAKALKTVRLRVLLTSRLEIPVHFGFHAIPEAAHQQCCQPSRPS